PRYRGPESDSPASLRSHQHRFLLFFAATRSSASVCFDVFTRKLSHRVSATPAVPLNPGKHNATLATYDLRENSRLTRLSPRAFDELRWYFDQRRTNGGDRHRLGDEERFAYVTEAYAAPRFQLLYARWLSQGDAVFDALQSGAISEAIGRGAGRIQRVG